MTLRCRGCGADVAEDGTTTYNDPPKEGEHQHDPAPVDPPKDAPTNPPADPPRAPIRLTMFEYLED